MSNLLIAFEVVLPLFLMLALGFFIKKVKLLGESGFDALNTLTFRIFLPILVFRNIYTSDLSIAFNGKYILTGIGITLVSFVVATIVVRLLEKDNRKRGVLVQGIFRSNFIIFGLSVAQNLYGQDACGPISMLITAIIPVYNILAVIALESARGGGKINAKNLLLGIVKNPLIIASALGMVFLLSGMQMPKVLDSTIGDLSKVATPLALVALGGSIHFSSARDNLKGLVIGLGGRLIAMPLVFLPVCVLLGFRQVELVGLLMMLAAPTAVSSFTMAQQMGGDGELAGQLVVFGTVFSVLTIFLWVYALGSLQLL